MARRGMHYLRPSDVRIVKMKTISVTGWARNLRRVLDHVVTDGEEILIERNHEQIARLVGGPGRQNALEAMAHVYHTLPNDVAATQKTDPRGSRRKGIKVAKGVRDTKSCLR
jgi:antitoxin (DNA-binding transcriptional repressor) of toxin-antitoxin stability system